jgi:hypothetical protein
MVSFLEILEIKLLYAFLIFLLAFGDDYFTYDDALENVIFLVSFYAQTTT